jgi:hypothetical protein
LIWKFIQFRFAQGFCDPLQRITWENRIGKEVEWVGFENESWKCALNCLYGFLYEKQDRPICTLPFVVVERGVKYSSPKKSARPVSGNGVVFFYYHSKMTQSIITIATLSCLLLPKIDSQCRFVNNTSGNEGLSVQLVLLFVYYFMFPGINPVRARSGKLNKFKPYG